MGGLSSKRRSAVANSHSRLIEDSDELEEFGAISAPRASEPPYPKAVFYIVVTEACERFSYFGMKTILTFYLTFRLQYSEDASTVIYHTFSMLCFFTPVLGALLADLSLGRYRTILWVSLLYLTGNVVLSLSAVPPLVPTLEAQSVVAIIGLVLIAFGTGGIKPCVSAFGGDQFTLPQQQRQLAQFFSIFYFSINLGALLSTIITPLLRENTSCFQGQCYFGAFGLPAMLMAVALAVFVSGSSTYKKLPATGTVLTSTASCIWMGLRGKARSVFDKESPRPPHWLDHARPKYGAAMVEEVRVFTSVLVLLLPLPFFWALFDQQGSRWTFQAARMDGKLGNITIQPDQMQVLNPLLILLMVPCMERWGYPLLEKCGWFTTPLQRVTGGGVMAAFAFIAAALVESRMEYNASVGAPPLCMMWLLPQYILITMGEVLFSVSGLQFSFTEAPPSLKSVMQACWLLTISFGNLIVVMVAESRLLPSQTMEFALFACLMLLDMVLFAILAYYYKPYRPVVQDSDHLDDKSSHYQDTDVMDMKGPNGLQRSVHPDNDPTLYAAPIEKERSFDSEESGVYDSSPCETGERRKVVPVSEKYTPLDTS